MDKMTDRESLAKRVWRVLAQKLHPDKEGGSEEAMKRVNAIRGNTPAILKMGEEYDIIKKEGATYDDSGTFGADEDFIRDAIPHAWVAVHADDKRMPRNAFDRMYLAGELVDAADGKHRIWCNIEDVEKVVRWVMANLPKHGQPRIDNPQADTPPPTG